MNGATMLAERTAIIASFFNTSFDDFANALAYDAGIGNPTNNVLIKQLKIKSGMVRRDFMPNTHIGLCSIDFHGN